MLELALRALIYISKARKGCYLKGGAYLIFFTIFISSEPKLQHNNNKSKLFFFFFEPEMNVLKMYLYFGVLERRLVL